MKQTLSHFGIGASEIAAVAGLNPFASPWDVYLVKTGQAAAFEGNEFTEWGHRLEPAIRQKYADETGAAIYVPTESMFHPSVAWARATPDGIVILDGDYERLVQCKNVGEWPGKAWAEAPPAHVQLQEQWELYVTSLDRADVAALIGGNEFRIYTVHRDDKMIADLVTIAEEFWRRVETRTPPPIDESEACKRHFEGRLKKSATELAADAELEAHITEWRRLHAESKRIEKQIDRLKNAVRAAMADAQADRIRSSIGAPYLQQRAGGTTTNWRLIAELLGSTKCNPDEFKALVAANSEQKPASLTLVPPRDWSKETA